MKPKKIIILGTGGNCVDILDTMNDVNKSKNIYECAGFLDDDEKEIGQKYHGVEVLDTLSNADKYKDCFFINGIGSPENFWKKSEIITKTNIPPERFVSIIHPTASVSDLANIANGTVIFQNVTITSNVRIGNHVIILPNSVISHDCTIGDFTTIAGGVCVSGGVDIGEHCYLGTNSTIKGGVQIGKNSLVGMGSVVLEDVAENSIVVGNPARFLKNIR